MRLMVSSLGLLAGCVKVRDGGSWWVAGLYSVLVGHFYGLVDCNRGVDRSIIVSWMYRCKLLCIVVYR